MRRWRSTCSWTKRSIIALYAGLLALGCASGRLAAPDAGQDSPARLRNAFERDRERCVLQTTHSSFFVCGGRPCSVDFGNDLAFQHCMEKRGWDVGRGS